MEQEMNQTLDELKKEAITELEAGSDIEIITVSGETYDAQDAENFVGGPSGEFMSECLGNVGYPCATSIVDALFAQIKQDGEEIDYISPG